MQITYYVQTGCVDSVIISKLPKLILIIDPIKLSLKYRHYLLTEFIQNCPIITKQAEAHFLLPTVINQKLKKADKVKDFLINSKNVLMYRESANKTQSQYFDFEQIKKITTDLLLLLFIEV